MADRLHLQITTPEKVVFDGEVEKANITTAEGEITVLPHHEQIVSVLKPGELRYSRGAAETPIAVGRGYLEVHAGRLTVLTESAERVEEIDEAKAEEARRQAQELMAQKLDEESFSEATAVLERSLAQLKFARKYRHRAHHGVSRPTLEE